VTIAQLVFYLFSIVAILGALGVVFLPNVVHAALSLILTLLGVAAFYLLLSSEFLFLVQILIYGGAVATIILFGLMLTRGRDLMPIAIDGAQKPVAFLVGIVLGVTILVGIVGGDWPGYARQVTVVDVPHIGEALFKRWEAPFEIASAVLLVALIGAIVISRPEEGEA
jgi:NADH-quinone oxidoreductase subunit J